MSWLSSLGSDIGNVWNSDIKPALENPWVDAGLLAGGALLTGGLLAPELGAAAGGLFGGEAAGASTLGGIDAITTGAAVSSAGAGGADAAVLGADTAGLFNFGGGGGAQWLDSAGTNIAPTSGLPFTGQGGATAADIAQDAAQDAGGLGFGSPPPAGGAGAGIDWTGGVNTATNSLNLDPAVMNQPGFGGPEPQSPWSLGGIAKSLAPTSAAGALGAAAGVGGLGYNLYQGYQQKQQLNAIQGQENAIQAQTKQAADAAQAAAAPELAQGEILQSYLSTGTLPAPMQAQLDQQVAAAKAQIVQGYGARGMSTDPSQNSALAQDLANVDQQALSTKGGLENQLNQAGTQMVQTANSLISQGVSAAQVSSQIPIMMQGLNLQLGQATSQAISSFAAAINGGNRSGNITIQGGTVQQQAA